MAAYEGLSEDELAALNEQERIEQQQQDPLTQMKEREVAIKEAEVQRKTQEGQAKIQLDTVKAMNNKELEEKRIEAQQESSGLKIGQQIASDLLENEQLKNKKAVEDFMKGVDIAKDIVKDSTIDE